VLALGQVAALGGSSVLLPVLPSLSAACIAALLVREQRSRRLAALFWQRVCVWVEFATSLSRTLVSALEVRDVGIALVSAEGADEPQAQLFTNGLAVLQSLAVSADEQTARFAAGAVLNVLQHPELHTLWTSGPAAFRLPLASAGVDSLIERYERLAYGKAVEPGP